MRSRGKRIDGQSHRGAARRPDRLDGHAVAWGLLASLAIHALAFLLLSGAVATFPSEAPPGAAGPQRAPERALVAVSAALGREEIVPPPRPRLAVAEPRVVPPLAPASTPFLSDFAARVRPGASPVSNQADGRGAGRSGAGPRDGRRPAVPRSVLPEWDPPASVRGMEVTVRVRVAADGRPTGEVELVPSTPDREFNRRLVEKALGMEYRPAREGGVPIPGWAEITFVF